MWNPELKISYIAFKEAHSDQNLPVAAIADLCGLHHVCCVPIMGRIASSSLLSPDF